MDTSYAACLALTLCLHSLLGPTCKYSDTQIYTLYAHAPLTYKSKYYFILAYKYLWRQSNYIMAAAAASKKPNRGNAAWHYMSDLKIYLSLKHRWLPSVAQLRHSIHPSIHPSIHSSILCADIAACRPNLMYKFSPLENKKHSKNKKP